MDGRQGAASDGARGGGSGPAPERSSPRGSRTSWVLRSALAAVLVALVATSAVLALTKPRTTVTMPTTTSTTTLPVTTTTTKSGSSTTSTTTTVPGAMSGPVTLPVVDHGCGLALAPPTSGPGAGVPRPVGHCTVLEIGDSLGADLGYGLSRHLAADSGLNLLLFDRASTGLANSWYYNWPVNLASDLAKYHPQLLIVCLGGNDEQNMTVNGNVVSFGSAAWKQDYLDYVREIVSEATRSGAYVLWIGMPIMQPYSYNQGIMLLNSLYQQAVTTEPDATFVPIWSLFANPMGEFESPAAVNGVETTLRSADGIHFSFSGEDVFATYVIREMAGVYHVALAPTDPAVITSWG